MVSKLCLGQMVSRQLDSPLVGIAGEWESLTIVNVEHQGFGSENVILHLRLDGLNAFLYQIVASLYQLAASGYLLLRQPGLRSHVVLVEHIDDALDVSLLKHLYGETLAFAHGATAADRLVDQEGQVEQLLLHVHDLLVAFLPVYDLLSEQVVRVVYPQCAQLGDVLVELGTFLLQTAILGIGCRKRQIGVVGYFVALQRYVARLHLQLAAVACRQSHDGHKTLKLHNKLEVHAVITGIVAPVMANALEELVLERLEFVGFQLAFHKSAYVNEGLGMGVTGFVPIHSLSKLFDGVFSCNLMKHTDTQVAGTHGLIVGILRPFPGAISGKVLPSAAFDADAPWFVDVVKFGYQSLETVAVVV